MRGMMLLALVVALASAPIAASTAQQRSVLAQALPGLWELSGVPGSRAPVRQCVADIAILGQFEHRSRSCKRNVISDGASSVVIQYACGPGDFGQSELHLITPRSLKISTQGISGQSPFNYVLQARRVGDCGKPAARIRH